MVSIHCKHLFRKPIRTIMFLLVAITLLNSAEAQISQISFDVPSQVYPQDQHWFLTTVAFDCNALNATNNVQINVQLPYEVINAQECYTLTTGEQQCSTTKSFYEKFQTSLASVGISAGSNLALSSIRKTKVQNENPTAQELESYVSVDFKLQVLGNNAPSFSDQCSVNVTILVSAATNLIGSSQSLDAEVRLSNARDSVQNTVVSVIGVQLDIVILAVPSFGVEGGEWIEYNITIDHSVYSTENALNLALTLTVDSDHIPLIDTLYYEYASTGTPVNFTLDGGNFAILTLPFDLVQSDAFKIRMVRSLVDALPLGQPVTVGISVDCLDAPGHSYTFRGYKEVDPDDLVYINNLGTNIARFEAGQQYNMATTFQIPKGAVIDLTIFGEFTSSDIPVIPISLDLATIQVESPLTYVGRSHISAFSSSNRKKRDVRRRNKRQVSQKYTSGVFGTVTNPHPGLSNAAVTVTRFWRILEICGGVGIFFLLLTAMFGFHGNRSRSKGRAIYWLLSLALSVSHDAVPGSVFSTIGLAYGQTVDPMLRGLNVVVAAEIVLVKQVEEVNNTAGPTYPTRVRFSSFVSHSATSNLDAANVSLTDGSNYFDVYFGDGFIGPPINELTIVNERVMTWNQSSLPVGNSMQLSYEATPNADLPEGENWLSSFLTYRQPAGGQDITLEDQICIYRTTRYVESVIYQHGFTALFALVGFIVGVLIVILIIFIIYKVRRRSPFDSTAVRPVSIVDTKSMGPSKKSGGLITDFQQSMRQGFNNLTQWSTGLYDDSIVQMLALKDKLKALRSLDNMDINGTSRVDQQLENERNQAMVTATKMLLDSLVKNGDVQSGVKDKSMSNFQKKFDGLDRDLNNDFKNDMETILRRLSSKNKEKLGDLLVKHEAEKEEQKEKVRHMSQKDQDEVMGLLKKQQETEMNELTFMLELEQKEELEKLRKEKVIRKRMGIKSLQQEALEDIKNNAKLSPEQADWLLKEHAKNQAAIDKIFDGEMSRQRMVLEEKLARRRALAENKDLQEDADSEMLNQVAEQHIGLIVKAKKSKVLTTDEAQAMIDEVQKQMLQMKARQDAEREKQEAALHKKLTERKRQRLEEQAKKHKAELTELDKKHGQTQTSTGYTDPVSVLQTRQLMVSHHRSEMVDLENDIDKEDAVEYAKLREKFSTQIKDDLDIKKQELAQKLKNEGISDDKLQTIMKQHQEQQAELRRQQEEDKQAQIARFKKQLSRRQADAQHRLLEEKVEQENLREHEDNVIRKLMDNQVALSETERDRILQEHEKQMVTVENSLTLNKLQQQRMLEEKLAKKRAAQLEKLQKKQNRETKKQALDEDADDEDAELEMMRRHAEDKMAVLRGDTLQLDDEMDQIRDAMMKERANALKEQEVKLGAMLAELQLSKAKEMGRIEQQQKAIHSLKTSLMDDLNDKGMLSDPECQKVIDIHQKEQEKLNSKLESQRQKQEMALQQRLQERLRQKEKQLDQLHQQEMSERGPTSGQSAAAKLKRAALATRHMVGAEKFRNRMESEISQTLHEMKRQNEVRRIAALQEKEIQFINGLVRLGKFKVPELESVLTMLFPGKSEAERKLLLDRIMEGISEAPKDKRQPEDSEQPERTLEQRVLADTMAKVEQQTNSGPMKGFRSLLKAFRPKKIKISKDDLSEIPLLNGANSRRRSVRKSQQLDPITLEPPANSSNGDLGRSPQSSDSDMARVSHQKKSKKRLDAGGRQSPDGYDRRYSQIPPSKLPPLEKAGPKKKKKGLARSHEADF